MSVNTILYILARCLVGAIQCLPLKLAGRLGRLFGTLAYRLDGRHRQVAINNLTECFPEKDPAEIRSLAKENFKRIGESYVSGIKTASLPPVSIRQILTVEGLDQIAPNTDSRWVFAVGHFGNFELYARCGLFRDGFRVATTYRGLRQPGLDRVLLEIREQTGALYLERRKEGNRLNEMMREGNIALGFLADQHAGDRGARLPFFGRECSTSTAPAVFALRYKCPLHTAICHREALGRWRIKIGERIPTSENGQPRSVDAISADVNRALEAAVRKDPANWFWVHRRWKPASRIQQARAAAKLLPAEKGSGETDASAD